MKHNLKVTLVLVTLFFLSHIVGLFIVDISNPQVELTLEDGTNVTVRNSVETPGIGSPEPMDHPYIPITIGVLFGTLIAIILIKFKKFAVMKGWHVLGISLCLYISFYHLITYLAKDYVSDQIVVFISALLGISISIFRYKLQNPYLHNFAEIFIYAGIASLFAAIFKNPSVGASIFYASIMLIIISIYDAIAVWQSKHMVVLAKAQTENKIFAGLNVPYKRLKDSKVASKKSKSSSKKSKSTSKREVKEVSAILGGGDIAFTLIFSSVILLSYSSMFKALVVSVITTISLLLIFLYAKKDKFYPAMPFLSAGCFVGLFLVNLF